jgi:uncharacterized membrane protein YukC
VLSLSPAVLALIEQIQQHPVPRVQQTIKAFIGLGVIIVLPMAMVWWARKRYRP